jgi:hypothetical protein
MDDTCFQAMIEREKIGETFSPFNCNNYAVLKFEKLILLEIVFIVNFETQTTYMYIYIYKICNKIERINEEEK